jgi:hypothetical protein
MSECVKYSNLLKYTKFIFNEIFLLKIKGKTMKFPNWPIFEKKKINKCNIESPIYSKSMNNVSAKNNMSGTLFFFLSRV